MFSKRKIQAAQARSAQPQTLVRQPIGVSHSTGVTPGKRPLVSKRPGELRLPVGVTPGKKPTPPQVQRQPDMQRAMKAAQGQAKAQKMKKGGAVNKAKPRSKK